MNGFLTAFHVITCFFIIFAVLLQVGRGAELGAAFGSMGQAQSSRGPQSFMAKFTTVIAILFMCTSALLTYQSSPSRQSSVMDKVELPAPAPAADPSSVTTETMPLTSEALKTAAPVEAQAPATVPPVEAPAPAAQ
ncbi:MAG: preprotein translocase subunit SecG [Candidatus Lambdaproteobacteria bacterium RIFOXYD1_FULL_56_27]|uniref:Protein-export membrane protein SecG n=1 Tax=Candidatus Lambdaproteobacteria bacterium RIFOXYD2_FULL_56_26 TaxID=1817773 RepID=A0A1F6H0X8_9PROT|nr:MAG: preprotein translocase subunit SecG [Candidatus Lambdaproteobacteria bacterium RIFOXYC1_FULL_56_13]OGH03981.1 MAG: preprotein translocase subunit SecG [Candidatus Lambdaproteobacteria bacterium RIFOXYD2_FULL_56_26]OGH08372.1 MAG: preprotein translocase subunit SecG [Candidatus Lambdaproteobacteria bacterium RIFOXYD1_FULL_56_27]